MEENFKVYPALTISKEVPCGHIYCIFNEKDDTFHKLTIKGDMSRECPCGDSWLAAISRILTYAMRRGIDEDNIKEGIIQQLLGHRCPVFVNIKEEKIFSCVDGIAKVMLEYSKSRDLVHEEA